MRIRTIAVSIALSVLGQSAAHAALTVSGKPTRHVHCKGAVCTATAGDAVLNVDQLQNLLASSDTQIRTGTATDDIVIAAPLGWVSARKLTLDAAHSIEVRQPVSDAGPGALVLLTNDGGSGGTLSFAPGGQIHFLSTANALNIDGTRYKLENDLGILANDIGAHPRGNYALMGDIDLSGKTYGASPIFSVAGRVEGLGNTIRNFTLTLTSDGAGGGLVTETETTGLIENLVLADADIDASAVDGAQQVGALVSANFGLLRGDFVSGTVQGGAGSNSATGGLAGGNYGQILHCGSSASVDFGAVTGGLAGADRSVLGPPTGTIDSSYATGTVAGSGTAGGLVGQIGGSGSESVTNSFATGDVSNLNAPPGQTGALGGLIGENNSPTLTNSYATGNVTGVDGSVAGGLVGRNDQTIANAYSIGHVSFAGCACGGLVGDDEAVRGSLDDTYWNLRTSGIADPTKGAGNVADDPGIAGLTTHQFRSRLPMGFDPSIWAEAPHINHGYPYLIANPPR